MEGIRLAQAYRPDVVLMDLVMDGMDGIETTRKLLELYPECKVIVLTSYLDDNKMYPVIEAGAFSYLLKTSRANEIADAIRAAARGQSVLESQVAAKMMNRFRQPKAETIKPLHEQLTEREMDVLKCVAKGQSNQEVAEELFIGIKTVKFHVTNIFAKLGVDDRTQAAIYAHKHGLENKYYVYNRCIKSRPCSSGGGFLYSFSRRSMVIQISTGALSIEKVYI